MTVDPEVITPEALSIVSSEGCIVYPTSTQPALGCLPTRSALDGLYTIKNRPSHMPVSIGVADLEQASNLVELTDDIPDLLASFPEGSLTLVLPAKKTLDNRLGADKVAIRVVSHPVAKALLRAIGPLTATSANISGTPPKSNCLDAVDALQKAGHKVGLVEGNTPGGSPSTLIAWYSVCDASDNTSIEVLREGIVPTEEVLQWWKSQI
ncbi:MAG: L-threonylcarbamoyladenylate synthase [Euryarchaeota archaeon]